MELTLLTFTSCAERVRRSRLAGTLALECRFLLDALGSLHQPMLDLAKLNGLTNPKNMDRFTRMPLSMGLG